MRGLAGKRILITRPPHKAQPFAEQLRALGAEPVVLPMITIEPVQRIHDTSAYDWVVFTSANTVQTLADDVQLPQVAAVGIATAGALQDRGIQVNLIAESHTAESLFETMTAALTLKGLKILLPQGDLARPLLGDLLRRAGALVNEVIVYRTIRPAIDPSLLSQPYDVVTFTSPSTVQHFIDLLDSKVSDETRIACIGPVTAAAAQEAGLPVHIMATPHTVEGLIEAMCDYFQESET